MLDGAGAEAAPTAHASSPSGRGGRIVAYRLGLLIFTVEGGKRVGVVGLGRGTQAIYVALNATECR